ncbi:hypothetical protein GQ600_20362 [Phytophthora cactorum]|nr:hypothetical protein GQ600_20362 [Phytophthora cactorum]
MADVRAFLERVKRVRSSQRDVLQSVEERLATYVNEFAALEGNAAKIFVDNEVRSLKQRSSPPGAWQKYVTAQEVGKRISQRMMEMDPVEFDRALRFYKLVESTLNVRPFNLNSAVVARLNGQTGGFAAPAARKPNWVEPDPTRTLAPRGVVAGTTYAPPNDPVAAAIAGRNRQLAQLVNRPGNVSQPETTDVIDLQDESEDEEKNNSGQQNESRREGQAETSASTAKGGSADDKQPTESHADMDTAPKHEEQNEVSADDLSEEQAPANSSSPPARPHREPWEGIDDPGCCTICGRATAGLSSSLYADFLAENTRLNEPLEPTTHSLHALEINTLTPSGTAIGLQTCVLASFFKAAVKRSVESALVCESQLNSVITSSLRVSSSRHLALQAHLQASNSLRFTLEAQESATDKAPASFARIGADYKTQSFFAGAKIDAVNGPTLQATLGGKVGDVAMGNDGGRKVQLDLTQTVLPELMVSSRFVFDRRKDKRSLRLMGKYALKESETVSSSIGSDGIFIGAFEWRTSKHLMTRVSAQMDLRHYDSDSHHLGVSIEIS